MQLKLYSGHERFFFKDKSLSEFGPERTQHSFRAGILRVIDASRSLLILRLETHNLCGVHARSRT